MHNKKIIFFFFLVSWSLEQTFYDACPATINPYTNIVEVDKTDSCLRVIDSDTYKEFDVYDNAVSFMKTIPSFIDDGHDSTITNINITEIDSTDSSSVPSVLSSVQDKSQSLPNDAISLQIK